MTTAVAVRNHSAYQELAAKYGRDKTNLRELTKEVAEPTSMRNILNAGAVVTGAAAVGVIKGALGDKVGGVPTNVIAATATITAGIFTGSPSLLFAGSGMLSGFIENATEGAVKQYMSKDSRDTREAA